MHAGFRALPFTSSLAGAGKKKQKSGEKMADWNAIRNEYVTGSASQRELARKYNVSQASINRRSRADNWDESRDSFRAKVNQKTEEIVARQQVDRLARLLEKGDQLERLLSSLMDEAEKTGEFRSSDVKTIASALKDLRDLYKADAGTDDVRYQKARELLGGVPDALDG